MSVGEALIAVMRWLHALATVVWLGGGAYALLILSPQLRRIADPALTERVRHGAGRHFSRWVNAALMVFIVSGVLLTVDRLASRGATVAYGIVLAGKVGLALWMFGIAQGLGRRLGPRTPVGRLGALRRTLGSPRLLLWLGAIVVLLSAVLQAMYEAALRR